MSRSTMPDPTRDTSSVTAESLASMRATRWRPGLAAPAQSEIFAPSREASGAGAALALALDGWRNRTREPGEEAEDNRAVIWVQTKRAAKAGGRPYRPGLPPEIRHRLIHVLAQSDEDALFALEEAVRCRDVAFVIGELVGSPRALDFTASRRLTLAAEKHGVPLYLVRLDGVRDLSSARMRWDVSAEPSQPPEWNTQAPGTPQWRAELFRARSHPPGAWMLREEGGALNAQKTAEVRTQSKHARKPSHVGRTSPAQMFGPAFGQASERMRHRA